MTGHSNEITVDVIMYPSLSSLIRSCRTNTSDLQCQLANTLSISSHRISVNSQSLPYCYYWNMYSHKLFVWAQNLPYWCLIVLTVQRWWVTWRLTEHTKPQLESSQSDVTHRKWRVVMVGSLSSYSGNGGLSVQLVGMFISVILYYVN